MIKVKEIIIINKREGKLRKYINIHRKIEDFNLIFKITSICFTMFPLRCSLMSHEYMVGVICVGASEIHDFIENDENKSRNNLRRYNEIHRNITDIYIRGDLIY